MDSPEIPGKRNGSSRWKFPGKKVKHFEVLPFPRFYRNERTVFCTICLHYQRQASYREEVKNLPVFC